MNKQISIIESLFGVMSMCFKTFVTVITLYLINNLVEFSIFMRFALGISGIAFILYPFVFDMINQPIKKRKKKK